MASDQLYLDKWPLGRELEILDIYGNLLMILQIINEVQITKQHQENDRGRRKNILAGSSDEDASSLIERTWWENVSLQRKKRAMLSVGFWEDLEQKEVDGILKVIIVSLLYFISWVSELCNNINIVSRVQLDWRGTSWLLPLSILSLESWIQIYWE